MSERKFEGLWDCKYCGAKAIGGLTKHCPMCGHPQDKGTRFYPGEQKRYLEDDIAKEYGKGADWICPYCDSLNRVHFKYCANCGGNKEEATEDYFNRGDSKTETEEVIDLDTCSFEELERALEENELDEDTSVSEDTEEHIDEEYTDNYNLYNSINEPKKSFKDFIEESRCSLTLGFYILIVIGILATVFWPRVYTGNILHKEWSRDIQIEEYRTLNESGWTVPAGGRVYDQRTEIHHYDKVIDHYETKTKQVPESVLDGYDTKVTHHNNGDGTFTERTTQVPRYKTVYRTETYQDPVYKDVPRYQTKYYYQIDRWVIDRTEKSSGVDNEPYWPEYSLGEKERKGKESGQYSLVIGTEKKEYSYSLNLNEWQSYKKDETVKIKIVAGVVKEIIK